MALLMISCSDDDSVPSDAIVGEWLTVGRETKSGEPRELSFCELYIFRDFNQDGTVVAKWTTGEAPTECSDLDLSSLKWRNIGNNRWEIGTELLVLSIIRLEGNVMVEENQDNEWIYFYERR